MTASLEANLEAMKLYMAQSKDARNVHVELLRTKCEGKVMVGEILISGTIDDEFHNAIVIVQLEMQPDGNISGEVMGAKEVGAEDARE